MWRSHGGVQTLPWSLFSWEMVVRKDGIGEVVPKSRLYKSWSSTLLMESRPISKLRIIERRSGLAVNVAERRAALQHGP